MPEIARAHKSNSHRLKAIVLSAACLVTLAACGQPKAWGHDWDGWIAEPGTKVTLGKDDSGNDTRTIQLASGVNVLQTRHGGTIETVEDDESGRGAVKCAEGVYLLMKTTLEICSPDEDDDEDLKADIDDSIERINGFIVANSVPPITMRELEKEMRAELEKSRARVSEIPENEVEKACTTGDLGKLMHVMRQWPEDKIPADITTLLAIRRPAVINPCM